MSAQLRLLTRRHQVIQIRNGASTAALIAELGARLRAGKLSRDGFVNACVASEILGQQTATRIAGQYLAQSRKLVAPKLASEPIAPPKIDTRGALRRATGTVTALTAVTETPDAVFDTIVGRYGTWAQKATLMSGRDLLVQSTELADTRWRRVTDGDPCVFCAMMVSRGAVYRDDSAEEYHERCGCTVEEVVTTWRPNADEQRYVDAYQEAAEAVSRDGDSRTAKNVLAKMRERPGFSDSLKPATK